jgi:hypothetical protein
LRLADDQVAFAGRDLAAGKEHPRAEDGEESERADACGGDDPAPAGFVERQVRDGQDRMHCQPGL